MDVPVRSSLGGEPWALEGHLFAMQAFLHHVPKSFVQYALLVGGHKAAQLTYQLAYAQALIVALTLDLLWSSRARPTLSWRWVAVCTALSTAFGAAVAALAFADRLEPASALALLTLQLALTIPANASRARWRLKQRSSPARYQLVGWVSAVGSSSLAILRPELATASVTILLTSAYPCVVCALLLRAHREERRSAPPAAATSAKAVAAPAEPAVPLATALLYLLFTVIVGTSAESINDMLVNHRVRAALSSGHQSLALTQNVAFVAAQLLALSGELFVLRPSDESRNRVYGFAWASFQVVRVLAMGSLLTPDATITLGALIFVDKYTGPLGTFAVDSAGVALLQAAASTPPRAPRRAKQRVVTTRWWSRASVPAAMLVSLRQMSRSYERPLWDILLLHETSWPLPIGAVVTLLACLSLSFIVAVLRPQHVAAEPEAAAPAAENVLARSASPRPSLRRRRVSGERLEIGATPTTAEALRLRR